MVPHGHYQHIHGVVGVDGLQGNAVFALHLVGVGDRVAHYNLHAPALEFAHHVDHFAVADVGAVFFERHAQNAHLAARGVHALAQHQLDGVARGVAAHVVVDAPPRQNDLRVVAHHLRLVGEVVRVYANAVPAHQAGAEGQKVPFAAGGLEHFKRIDAQPCKQHRQFIDKGNVQVALGVFNHLGRFGHADGTGRIRARRHDAGV